MIKLMIKLFRLSIITVIISTVIACDSEEPEPVPITFEFRESNYVATIQKIIDLGNKGNASDLYMTFEKATFKDSVSEYRLLIAEETAEISSATVINLPSTQYLSIPSDGEEEINLPDSQMDITGSLISNNISYKAYILSVASYLDSTAYSLSEAFSFSMADAPFVSTLASSIAANDAVSIDSLGNVYISEYGNYNQSAFTGTGSKVIKVTPEGEVSTFVNGLQNGVLGSTFDRTGNFYVVTGSNYTNGNIIKVLPDGTQQMFASIDVYPAGLAISEEGNLFVSNYWDNKIHSITPSGEVSIYAENALLDGGVGIAFYGDDLIIGNFKTGDILRINPQRDVEIIATIPTVVFESVIGYIDVLDETIYATGINSNIIYEISLEGDVKEFAGNGISGNTNGGLLTSSFSNPNGIRVDKNNRILYISENIGNGKGNLRMIQLD